MVPVSRLAWMVLVLALVGAVASLLGPHERVGGGVNIGATGTAIAKLRAAALDGGCRRWSPLAAAHSLIGLLIGMSIVESTCPVACHAPKPR
jgi:hypothetical protein